MTERCANQAVALLISVQFTKQVNALINKPLNPWFLSQEM